MDCYELPRSWTHVGPGVARRLGLRGRPAVLRLTGARLARVRVIIGVLGCRGVKRRLAVAGRAVWRPGMCLLTVLPAVRAIWRRRVAGRLAHGLVIRAGLALPQGHDGGEASHPLEKDDDLKRSRQRAGQGAAASRVSKPNRTVDRIRAQDRPRLFAHAIQSHRPPARASPPPSRPAPAGSSSEPTPG